MNTYHLRHNKDICAQKRRKYALSEPKSDERERHMKNLADNLFQDKNFTIRSVKTVEINNKDDFGDTLHMVSTEVYFYDSAYQLVKRQQALPVDKQGKCVVAESQL